MPPAALRPGGLHVRHGDGRARQVCGTAEWRRRRRVARERACNASRKVKARRARGRANARDAQATRRRRARQARSAQQQRGEPCSKSGHSSLGYSWLR